MKTAHAIQRAYERYNILNFSVSTVLSDILNGRCIQTNEDLTKFSRTFVVLYVNKYIQVVTDYNIRFVKTVLPFDNNTNLINTLISKIIK